MDRAVSCRIRIDAQDTESACLFLWSHKTHAGRKRIESATTSCGIWTMLNNHLQMKIVSLLS
jgi:hypothetical protein